MHPSSSLSSNTLKRTAFWALALLLCLVALPASAEIERSFDTGSGGTFTVDADGASVNIETNGGSETAVLIERRRGSERIENDYDISFDQSGADLKVLIERKNKNSSWRGNSGLKVTVQLPQRSDIDIATSGGSLSVSDLDGKVVARTSGGSIRLGRIDGEVDAKTSGGSISLSSSTVRADLYTSGGSITAGDINGTVNARTSGGSVSIDRADGDVDVSTSGGSINLGLIAGSIAARTSGGSVTASFTEQPTEASELRTSGGTVRVSLASGIGFDLDARASSGVTTEVPIEVRGTIEKTKVQGQLNGGGPPLVLRASGGKVVISER